MSASISLLRKTLMVFCVIKFTSSSLVDSWASSLSFMSKAWRAGTKLNIRKSRCGLLGLCRSAARMWLAVSSPSCTSALHSVHPGMTGIPVWREPAWRRTYKNLKCPGRDTGKEKLRQIDLMPFPDVWQWHWERNARPLLMWIYLLRKVRFGPGQFVVVRYIRQYNHGASWCLQTGKSRCNWWVIKGKEIKSWQTRQIYRWSWIFYRDLNVRILMFITLGPL